MKINKDKSIGRVLFIVEGGKTEFTLLRRIFCNVLGYEYVEKRRDKANFFRSRNISTSKIAVINTEEIRYSQYNTYKLVSLISVALIDLGIIDFEDTFKLQ